MSPPGSPERDAGPATRDAVLVRRLEAEGAVLVATHNMDEYAYGFTTENSHYGATCNPHDTARISGGSSGGSAAAVAAGQVPFSLGSDTNGSIRVPASLCGTFGLKPTFGRLPRSGTYPFVASLDHLGPFARSVADLALAYDLMQGPDDTDPACAQRAIEPASPGLERGINTLRVAVLGGWFREQALPEALAAVDQVAQALGYAQLLERGARLVQRTHTSAQYRLHALPGQLPPKPGLARVAQGGHAIEVEVYDMPLHHMGSFLALIPPPLGLGSIELADGQWVKGFICEPWALQGAADISEHGGWRHYIATLAGNGAAS